MDTAIKYMSFVAALATLGVGALFAYFIFVVPSDGAGPTPQSDTSSEQESLFGAQPTSVMTGGDTTSGGIQTSDAPSSRERAAIRNRDGVSIEVNAFLPDLTATSTWGVDATGPSPVVPLYWEQDASFSAVFNRNNDFFNVSLLKEPLAQSRAEGETYLLDLLGISQSDACRLNYSITVPEWINPLYTNKNLGFSFCPGAVQL